MANPLETPVDSAAGAEASRWDQQLRDHGVAESAASQKAYLKSDLEFAGTGVPAIRSMVTGWRKTRRSLTHDEVTALVQALWASPLYECRQAAVVLLARTTRLLGAADMELVEHMLRTSHTWA
ncbi:MAG: DNA alkylation repair protein, partial [Nocardiopsaceae bacterium]|nr:DNA alkylation repair protein [Nocardiopsaceae bacterium]